MDEAMISGNRAKTLSGSTLSFLMTLCAETTALRRKMEKAKTRKIAAMSYFLSKVSAKISSNILFEAERDRKRYAATCYMNY